MKVEKNELAKAIKKIQNVIPARTTMPVLQGVLVADGYLVASNVEMTVRTKLEGIDGEPFIIPSKTISLINNLPAGEIDFSLNDAGDVVTMKAGKIKNSFQTCKASDFPDPTKPAGGGDEIVVSGEELMASIRRVSVAISQDTSKGNMTALCLKAHDGDLDFVAIDGYMIAWDRISYKGDFELLIPKNTVDKLLSLELTGAVTIRHDKHSAVFITEQYEVYTRLRDGTYYDYARLFPSLELRTFIERGKFLDAAVRANVCSDNNPTIRIDIADDNLDISLKNNANDYHETVDLGEKINSSLSIGFDVRRVISILKAFDSDNVGLQFKDAKSAMVIESEDSDFKAMVLPVSM